MEHLIKEIESIAGPQRANTFKAVARAALVLGAKTYVETGCYRGIHFDGQSTLIWAKLAQATGGHATAIDISLDSIRCADNLLGSEMRPHVSLVLMCSLQGLKQVNGPIDVLYLDSFDHDPNNPEPCQQHQLAEARIAIPKMAERSIILLDDCNFSTGGKSKLSHGFIIESGWKCVAQEYQNVYERGCDNLF
jgi:hypothetical protein